MLCFLESPNLGAPAWALEEKWQVKAVPVPRKSQEVDPTTKEMNISRKIINLKNLKM